MIRYLRCRSAVSRIVYLLLCFLLSGNYMQGQSSLNPFKFREAGPSSGLFPSLDSIYGHGAGWGDVNGDGWPDLYVGTFRKDGAKKNMFFLNDHGQFRIDTQQVLEISTRTTGVVFADFDNDGDLDLYVASMSQVAGRDYENEIVGCTLLSNNGKGIFKNISEGNGACPKAFGGRSASVFDFDGDGLLDIVVGEDWHTDYNGSATKSSRLFRNLGNLQFEDVSRAVGIRADIPGYGTAVSDVNDDGWPDLFIASNDGGNILFINDRRGKFIEVKSSKQTFHWKGSGEANMVCGVAFGDINRDGRMDIVLGPHFLEPWLDPQSLRLFLNTGNKNGEPVFKEVTKAAGLEPLSIKAPHVEIQDFDNDGWPDIYTTVVKFNNGVPYPLIYRNPGIKDKVSRFEATALTVNDFPAEDDKRFKRGESKLFFDHIFKENTVMYTAPGPTADYDKDGRLDMMLPSFWPEKLSMLLHNETKAGNWIQVKVEGTKGINSMGIGNKIKIYRAGMLSKPEGLLGVQEINVGYGYASGQEAMAHFGLGKEESVDIQIIYAFGKGSSLHRNIRSNQRVFLK